MVLYGLTNPSIEYYVSGGALLAVTIATKANKGQTKRTANKAYEYDVKLDAGKALADFIFEQ